LKKFIFRFIIYILPLLIVVLFSFIALIVVNNYLSKNSELYQLEERIDYLFIGDSHISLGVNDRLIPSSKNISSLAEPYYFTYQKLKFFLKQQQPKTIFLGFSYANLSDNNDKFLFGSASTFFPDNYFFILNSLEKVKIIFWNRGKLLELFNKVHHSLYCHINNINQQNNHLYDGYNNTFIETKALPKRITARVSELFYENGSLRDFSKQNIKYFFKIIELCQKSDIKLFLLSTPLSKLYYNNVPTIYKRKFNEISSKSKISHINLIKYLDQNSLFLYDGDHLNKNGAEILSKKLIKELKNKY
tara:strand:- start:5040 stop:5948 length:909 start_codon:yes stop_codon:yes gene_type:complete